MTDFFQQGQGDKANPHKRPTDGAIGEEAGTDAESESEDKGKGDANISNGEGEESERGTNADLKEQERGVKSRTRVE
ncbi:hypothetical protein NDU88_002445 [Pleurodeles waltl]|uniref:Uncharacterized protein n=1 Tax=Pleurodeles waltl TaxID=8319 RepID=A0AAV7UB68_PLEWA|nr:hypothetical protein NDU88_002445 [Pleurodeles waltl]